MEWDKVNHFETDYNSFHIQLAVLDQLQSKKLKKYKDIVNDVLMSFSDNDIVENVDEGNMTARIYTLRVYFYITFITMVHMYFHADALGKVQRGLVV